MAGTDVNTSVYTHVTTIKTTLTTLLTSSSLASEDGRTNTHGTTTITRLNTLMHASIMTYTYDKQVNTKRTTSRTSTETTFRQSSGTRKDGGTIIQNKHSTVKINSTFTTMSSTTVEIMQDNNTTNVSTVPPTKFLWISTSSAVTTKASSKTGRRWLAL